MRAGGGGGLAPLPEMPFAFEKYLHRMRSSRRRLPRLLPLLRDPERGRSPMKTANPGRIRRILPPILLGTGIILTVFYYNVWSYCCGRCSGQTLLSLGIPGYTLLGLIAAALALWGGLKIHRSRRMGLILCNCGAMLQENWRFCPDCGSRRLRPPSEPK